MKRFWHTCLAVVATAAIVSSANAQSDWNQSAEIGSYQSILKRAGYGAPPSQDGVPAAPGEMPIADAANPVVMGQPTQGCAGGGCDTGMFSSCGADCGGCSSCDAGCMGGIFGGDQARGSSSSNTVVGVKGLYFFRDSEDDVPLSRNGAGDILLSTDAHYNTMGGFQFDITKRNCDGNGFQLVYWGLYPGQKYAEIVGPGLDTYLTGLSDVFVAPGAQDLLTYFNGAESNFAFRESDIQNIEANLLRGGGNFTTRSGRSGTYEMLFGFRWFQFNELFGIGAFNTAGNPQSVDYEIDVHNTLLGFQLGGRREYCVSDKFNFSLAGKLGIYNNGINHRQTIRDSNDVFGYRTASGVDDYNSESTKNDLSMLGELDLGMNYRLSSNCRVSWGYRAVGITGIALAPNQLPNDFTDDALIHRTRSNGDLILGGGYAGLEFCF
jgi:hypothetical protein